MRTLSHLVEASCTAVRSEASLSNLLDTAILLTLAQLTARQDPGESGVEFSRWQCRPGAARGRITFQAGLFYGQVWKSSHPGCPRTDAIELGRFAEPPADMQDANNVVKAWHASACGGWGVGRCSLERCSLHSEQPRQRHRCSFRTRCRRELLRPVGQLKTLLTRCVGTCQGHDLYDRQRGS